MKPVTVVLAVTDPITSEALSGSLRAHFRAVLSVAGAGEIRPSLLKHRADVVVIDMESTAVEEIASLLRDFSQLSVVCIHRLPDDRLWSSVLAAGALDCCHPSDVRGIVMAVNRDGKLAQGHAA